MLSQLNKSSKKMCRLKKYNNSKNKGSGFQFLLRSLERDKENQAPNMLTAHPAQLTHSLFISPMMTAPVHSFTLNNQYTNHGTDHFIMQNVKILDRSDASISDQNKSIISKKETKKRDESMRKREESKCKRKYSTNLNSTRSKIYNKNQVDEFFYKMKQYLTLTDEFISEARQSKSKKKAKLIAQQLISLITNLEGQQYQKLTHSIKTTSFNIEGIDNLNKGEAQYMKIINHLELEKDKLNNLISQHEMANIKMYIKLNEDQSEEIQQCKKQLAFLFQKYKKLQGFIGNDKKRIIQMIKEKEKLSKHCQQLTDQNNQMLLLIQKYQDALSKQNDQKKQSTMQSVNSSANKSVHFIDLSKVRGQFKGQGANHKSVFSKGELKIQSLNISENQTNNSFKNVLDSSIATKNTTRIRHNEGKMGINLNALLQNMTQCNISKLKEDPRKWGNLFLECKQILVKMKTVIDEQNQELQMYIKNIQDYKEKQLKKDQLIKNLQSKIASTNERLIQKTNEKCIVKQKNSLIIQNKAGKKLCENSGKQIIHKEGGRIIVDKTTIKNTVDQYRIIAMQALALEEMLNHSKIK